MTNQQIVSAILATVAAGASIAASVFFGLADRQGPARCPDGLIAEGARCCGLGQHVSLGRCVGRPQTCALTQSVTAEGCVAPPKRISYPGGKALLGSPDWEGHEARGAASGVVPYELDAYEVTVARFQACVTAQGCTPEPIAGEPGEPVRGVTPEQAEAFCRFVSGHVPTGAEWILAAMGREARRFAWGSTGLVCRRAAYGMTRGPCAEDATGPELAGSRPDGASPEGALDLSGNVAEWTREATGYVARGGSYRTSNAGDLKSWSEERAPTRPDIGFRCAYPAHGATR